MVSLEFALSEPPDFLEDGVVSVAGREAAGCSVGFSGGGLESTILGVSVAVLKDSPSLLSEVSVFTFGFSMICSCGTGLDSGDLVVATAGGVLGLTVFFLGTTSG